jgi:hypothetical protein
MSADSEIPTHVLRFLEENIESVPQLETLLMMSEAQDRHWPVGDVAARNYITERRAEETLNALRRRGLVAVEESPPGFRFSPATDSVRSLVAEVGRCYRANLSRIATLIHSKRSTPVKEFARAFDLKKDH